MDYKAIHQTPKNKFIIIGYQMDNLEIFLVIKGKMLKIMSQKKGLLLGS